MGDESFTGKEVQVEYACKTPIGDKTATSPVQIDATKSGGSFALTVKFGKSVMHSPADIPADSVKPSMAVKVGGADKGTVAVEGPTNKEPIKSGAPIQIPDLTGTYKPGETASRRSPRACSTVKALGTTTPAPPPRTPAPRGSWTPRPSPAAPRAAPPRPAGPPPPAAPARPAPPAPGQRHQRRTRRDRLGRPRRPHRARSDRPYDDPARRRDLHPHPVAQAARHPLTQPASPRPAPCGGANRSAASLR